MLNLHNIGAMNTGAAIGTPRHSSAMPAVAGVLARVLLKQLA